MHLRPDWYIYYLYQMRYGMMFYEFRYVPSKVTRVCTYVVIVGDLNPFHGPLCFRSICTRGNGLTWDTVLHCEWSQSNFYELVLEGIVQVTRDKLRFSSVYPPESTGKWRCSIAFWKHIYVLCQSSCGSGSGVYVGPSFGTIHHTKQVPR